MMLPAILILRFDAPRHVVVPLPIFLLWPLVLIGLVVAAIAKALIHPRASWLWLRLALSVLFNLRGLQVNLRSRAGDEMRIDFR